MSSSPPLKVAFEEFLISLEAQGRSSKTIETYRQRLSTFLQHYGNTAVSDITPNSTEAWLVTLRRKQELWADHPGKPTKEGKLSEATISSRLQALKTVLKWCVARGYIEKSPAAHLKRIKYGCSDKVMERKDLVTMLGAAKTDENIRDYAILAFIADTGARVGEVASLTLKNLNLNKCEATVSGKTNEREVYFTPATAKVLGEWLAVRPNSEDDAVFVGIVGNHTGRRLLPGGIYQAFKRLGGEAGVEGATNPHSVRHLVGRTYVERENLVMAQRKLGHKDVSTTAEFYAHQDKERVKKATERTSLITGIVY